MATNSRDVKLRLSVETDGVGGVTTLADDLRDAAAAGNTAAPVNTINVRITLPDSTVKNVPTTQEGSYALIAALKSAKLSAGY